MTEPINENSKQGCPKCLEVNTFLTPEGNYKCKNCEFQWSKEEERGTKAIIFLQSKVGIIEARDVAFRNWRAMKNYEKESTMNWYESFLNRKMK